MHFTVLVIIPDKDERIIGEEQLGRAVDRILAPYSESTYFDTDYDAGEFTGEWDWYLVGGRWTGFFDVDYMCGFHGEPGLMTEPCTDPYTADAVRNKDILGAITGTHALLTPDGWCELCTSWSDDFNSGLFFQKITEAHPNDWFVLVDCHV